MGGKEMLRSFLFPHMQAQGSDYDFEANFTLMKL